MRRPEGAAILGEGRRSAGPPPGAPSQLLGAGIRGWLPNGEMTEDGESVITYPARMVAALWTTKELLYDIRQAVEASASVVPVASSPDVNVTVELDLAPVVKAVEDLSQAVSESNALLRDLSEALRNPAAVAADELYRRGVFALRSQWIEEAVSDLSASLERFPYRPAAHFAIGSAYLALGSPLDADAAFQKAIRYGTRAEADFALAAALQSARVRRVATSSGWSLPLEAAEQTLPFSAWIAVERERLSGTDGLGYGSVTLRQAMEIARPGSERETERAWMARTLPLVERLLSSEDERSESTDESIRFRETCAIAAARVESPHAKAYLSRLASGTFPTVGFELQVTDRSAEISTTRKLKFVPLVPPSAGLLPVGERRFV